MKKKPKPGLKRESYYEMTLEEIGAEIGEDPLYVHNIIKNAMRKIRIKKPKLKELIE